MDIEMRLLESLAGAVFLVAAVTAFRWSLHAVA